MHSRSLRLSPALLIVGALAVGDARAADNKADAKNPKGQTAAATKAAASVATEANPLAGHSLHGEAFNEGPRQKAYLMAGVGHSRFPITTKAPLAQQFFNQGVGQLHGFWYFEAERSFRQVAALDPGCAMAYWGMAMANLEQPQRAEGFIKKAVERKASASRHDGLWIDALAAFLNTKDVEKTRRRQFVRALENIIHEFPDDLEAKAFLAWLIWVNAGRDLPITSHQAVDSVIGEVLRGDPMHPGAHHYRIHLWDSEKAAWALESAARCGQSAPGIAHCWHMPGHIYSQLKRYSDAAWQQEASARVDHAYMMRDRVLPYQIHNYAHNNQWLVTDLSHLGRARAAIDLAKNLIELPRHPKRNSNTDPGSAARSGRARLFEVLSRYELWPELLALTDSVFLEPTDIFEEQVLRLRMRGIAFVGKGDVPGAETTMAALNEMLAKEQAEATKPEPTAKTTAAKAGKAAKAGPAVAKTGGKKDGAAAKKKKAAPETGRSKQIQNALAEVNGHLQIARGQKEKGLEQLLKADGVRKTRLALAALHAGNKAKAEQLSLEALEAGKNEVEPLAVRVEVLHGAGKAQAAAAAFAQLRLLAAEAEPQLPIFQRLAPLAQTLKYPADWRAPLQPAADVGVRPALSSLGPFRWQPMPAPTWELATETGSSASLAQYRGKPVVVIFYLGVGCTHCVEQLKKFAPLTKKFADAGISLVGISTDPMTVLKESRRAAQQPGLEAIPFPLLSDESLTVFKKYRCFDDFENRPLHGTFVVDGRGLVRWQDISFEPFTDAAFLLTEAQRLLAQPVAGPVHVSAGQGPAVSVLQQR